MLVVAYNSTLEAKHYEEYVKAMSNPPVCEIGEEFKYKFVPDSEVLLWLGFPTKD
jgi:hypothetical protein